LDSKAAVVAAFFIESRWVIRIVSVIHNKIYVDFLLQPPQRLRLPKWQLKMNRKHHPLIRKTDGKILDLFSTKFVSS